MIRAPFDGVVLEKHANVGDNITPFSSASDSKGAVVTIADMKTLEVEADVAESNIAKIAVDQPCEIQLDALPDMSAKIAFLSKPVPPDQKKALVAVQPGAVVTRGGKQVVYVVENDKAREVTVMTGERLGDLLAVQGVKPGDTLVLAPNDRIKDGANITVAKK